MKQNLFNKLWLRVGMIVAIMTTALSGTAWAESVTLTAGTNGSTCTVNGNAGIKVGTSKAGGDMTITVPANTVTLHLHAAAWKGVSGLSLNITGATANPSSINLTADDGISNNSPFTLSGNESDFEFSVDLSNITTETTITLTSSAAKRFVVWGASADLSGGSTLTTSDLAITNAPVALSFDLYNNSSAQTVSYTTSSTGAVTVSGGTGYVTTSVNTETKTVTVTPTAVTPSAQTITISQEADATYAAGSKTFTVTITDSTPFAGGDVTFDATKDKDNTTAGAGSIVKNSVTFSCSNGILGNGTEYRLYKNSVTTFSVLEGTITQIVFTGTSDKPASGFGSQTGWTTDGNNGTWTGNATSVSFTASGDQVRATQIVVTVDLSATPDPTFTISNNNEIAYNATSGSFNFTVNNPVSGGETTVSENVDWISNAAVSGNSVSFETTANDAAASRNGIITLTYTYNTNETVTKEVTVTQAGNPNITNIPDLFTAATSTATTVSVTFNNWVVSGVSTNGKNVFVTDNTGKGFVIFDTNGDLNNTYSVGNILSGTISCSLKLNSGYAQLTGVSGLSINTGGTISEANIAMANLAGVNTGALVSYENLTCSIDDSGNTPKYYLTDGTTTLQVYTSLYAFGDALVADKSYNITGIYQQFNSTKEILPRSAADIEEYVAPQHTVSFSVNGVVTSSEDVSEGAAITFPATPADVNGKTFMGWTTEEISGTTDTTPTIVTSAIMGTADVTYYAVFATSTSGGASDTYALVSDVSDLSDGDKIILVSTGSYTASQQTHYFTVANGSVNSSNLMDPVDVTITDNQVTSTEVAPITLKAVTGGWKLQMGTEYINIVSTKNQITLDENGAVNTISITSGDATIDTADGSDTRLISYNPNNGNGRFAYYKSTQKPVSIYKQEGGVTYSGYCTTVAPATVPVALNAYGYTTFSSNNAVSIPENGDFTAWQITNIDNDNKITFVQVTGNVKAGTGLFLKGTASDEITIETAASGAELQDNILVGFPTATNVTAGEYYGLSGNQFVKVKAGTVKAGKALLPAHLIYESNSVKPFTFVFEEDDATGISMMEDGRSLMEDGAIYNVAGQRISKMQKGINIVNGKKIAVK